MTDLLMIAGLFGVIGLVFLAAAIAADDDDLPV